LKNTFGRTCKQFASSRLEKRIEHVLQNRNFHIFLCKIFHST
jgi:hypothetical protein